MAINIGGKADLNEFAAQAGAAASKLGAKTAALYNDSGKPVTFKCYNGSDLVCKIAFTKPLIASGYSGEISAGGAHFKVHPDGNRSHEFLVKPRTAYIYEGPGKLTEVK
ncbi:MAG: hypothetical protein AAGD40_07035 [Pseudomonadota bacterium]